MNTIDLESLRCVDTLARTLHFAAAARASALSPSAFGARVRAVEEELGTALFARTTRRVQLTREGAALLPRIRALLDGAHELRTAARGEEPPFDLTIGTRHELGMSWLLPARLRLKESLPAAHIHLRFGSAADLESAVLLSRIDAAVLSRPAPSRSIVAVPLHKEEYVLVGAARALKRSPVRHAADLAAHVLVDADDSLPLVSYVREASLRFQGTITLGTIDAIRAVVRAGEGVAVLPRYFVAADLAKGSLVRLLPRLPIAHDEFRLLFRADHARRGTLEDIAARLARFPLR